VDRLVIDTNVLVSAAMLASSVPGRVVDRALDRSILLFSESTMNELKEVLSRSKFDSYVSRRERAIFLAQLESISEPIPTIQLVRECRDPKDDKFLEVALNGGADAIITGDAYLLRMNPWRGIEILAPAAYSNSRAFTR